MAAIRQAMKLTGHTKQHVTSIIMQSSSSHIMHHASFPSICTCLIAVKKGF